MIFPEIPHPSGYRRETWRKHGANMEQTWRRYEKYGTGKDSEHSKMKGGKGGKVDYD